MMRTYFQLALIVLLAVALACPVLGFIKPLELRPLVRGGENETLTIVECKEKCNTPITWAWPQSACTLNGTTVANSMCSSGVYAVFMCMQSARVNPVGVSYPGTCGCPSFCSNSTGNGMCVDGSCQCKEGWSGADCSIVNSSNQCSYRGAVTEVNGYTTCECYPGSALSDCSAIAGPIPELEQIIPSTQYSDEDKYGNDNPIFDTSTIGILRFDLSPIAIRYMQDPANQDSSEYHSAAMWFYNGEEAQTFSEVGIRIKGGASRGFSKKSYKVSLNEYVSGQSWFQQKKLSVKSMQMDPGATREKICLDLLYSMNAVAQRAAYTELFFNDHYMGMYILLENIGDPFLKSRFGNNDGLLYKCLGDFEYLGPDPETYANLDCGDTLCYKPETDAAEDTSYEKLTQLITTINMTDADFAREIGSILDVDLFLRTLVVEVGTGNWDGIWNCNNYFLYYNYDVDLFQYFRHDLDISFGTIDNYYNMATKNVYAWGEGGRGYRLINKVLGVAAFREAYTEYFYQFFGVFNAQGALVQQENFLSTQVSAGLLKDQWRFLDMGWEYYSSLSQQTVPISNPTSGFWSNYPDTVSESMFGFMQKRITSARDQLDPRKPLR